MAAAGVALLFQRLRLPIILGYILAGLLIGPNLFAGGLVSDAHTVEELAELGVIFLVFYLGLQFNIGRLQRILAPAGMALLLQTLFMMVLGLQSASFLGMSSLNGLFLGALLAISSSMVTVAALRARNEMQMPRAQLAVGILIGEDILAVLLLVILSGVAVEGRLLAGTVWLSILAVGVFVTSVFVIGKLAAPRVLATLEKFGNMETITLFAVAMTLGVAALAMQVDLSVALGAFLAGSILSQCSIAKELEHTTEPMLNVFGAVFFVAIGMKVQPMVLLDNVGMIIVLAVLVVLGKIASCWFGLYLSGQPSKPAFCAAVAKAQIGEFSFIIAALGQRLGVVDDRLMTFAVGVALLSILSTPILMTRSESAYDWMSARMPRPLQLAGQFYRNLQKNVTESLGRNAFVKLIRRPVLQVIFYFFLINGVVILAYFGAQQVERVADPAYATLMLVGVWALTAVVSLPLLIAVIRNLNAIVMLMMDATFSASAGQTFRQGRLRGVLGVLVQVLVFAAFGAVFLAAATPYFPTGATLVVFVALIALLGVVFWRQMIRFNSRMEWMFMDTLNAEVRSKADERREATMREIAKKYPWPVHVRTVKLPPDAAVAGYRIADLDLRERTGVNIVGLSRSQIVHYDPSPNTPLFPGDRLYLFGEASQMAEAAALLEATADPNDESRPNAGATFNVQKLLVGHGSPLVGETLAGAELRKRHGISVLGIQRGDRKITAPPPEELMEIGDVLLVMGDPKAIERLQTSSLATN